MTPKSASFLEKPKWVVRATIGHEVFVQECWTDSFATKTFRMFVEQFPQGTVSQRCVANGRIVRKHG